MSVHARASYQGSTLADVIVAIPARDEAERVTPCLAALARQRDGAGTPLDGVFEVILLANNCTDDTAARARALQGALPYRLHVAEIVLPSRSAHAGGARKAVMDVAAERLEAAGQRHGAILTTDVDSRVAPTWVDANMRAFAAGADVVAGYIDADSDDFLALGPVFGRRGRLEDRYLRLIAEIHALCDPRPYDPWPNHRVTSGASLGVTLMAYRAVGGPPPIALGEDAGFVHALDCEGFRIRHSMQACVSTSCRFDSRAAGGAGDTMRARHADPEAPCDDEIRPALDVLRRAALKGRLRRLHGVGSLADLGPWVGRLALPRREANRLALNHVNRPFALLWDAIAAKSPMLVAKAPLRPSELPREIAVAERIVATLRRQIVPTGPRPQADRPALVAEIEPAAGQPSLP